MMSNTNTPPQVIPQLDECTVCHGNSGGVPGNENIIAGELVCDYCHARLIVSKITQSIGRYE